MLSEEEATFSFGVTVAFTLNYIIGAGFLTLPWGFNQTGWLLGIVVLAFLSLFAVMAALFVLEAMARAEFFASHCSKEETYGDFAFASPAPVVLKKKKKASISAGYQSVEQQSSSSSDGKYNTNDSSEGGHNNFAHQRFDASMRTMSLNAVPLATVPFESSFRTPVKKLSSASSTYQALTFSRGNAAAATTVTNGPAGDTRLSKPNNSLNNNSNSYNNSNSNSSVDVENGVVSLQSFLVVGKKKFEIVELCEIFLGTQGTRTYSLLLCLYMYGTLWAYSAVFSNAMASQFPVTRVTGARHEIDNASYYVYLVVFSAMVVPASVLELTEQVSIQVALAIARVVMLGVMVLTIVCAVLHTEDSPDSKPFGSLTPTQSISDNSSEAVFETNKMYLLMPIAAYAMVFHHSIPALSHPVRDKLQLGGIFTAAILFCFVAYAAIGLVVSLYFGDKILTSSNLNWSSYIGTSDSPESVSYFSAAVALFVVLLPAFDVASAYPLNAITLGNNLMSAYYGSSIHKVEGSRWARSSFRLIAAMPPILGAACVADLSVITHFTGVSGFALAFLFPALLALYSERRCKEHNLSSRTFYSNWLTITSSYYVCCAAGVFLIVYVLGSLIMYGSSR